MMSQVLADWNKPVPVTKNEKFLALVVIILVIVGNIIFYYLLPGPFFSQLAIPLFIIFLLTPVLIYRALSKKQVLTYLLLFFLGSLAWLLADLSWVIVKLNS